MSSLRWKGSCELREAERREAMEIGVYFHQEKTPAGAPVKVFHARRHD